MSATTFKNMAPKRKYKERAQPNNREFLGLLEKKKDYKQRAINYHKKEDKINRLRLKASLKNEDEFNFKMVKGKLKDGAHVYQDSSEDEGFDVKEYKKMLKTQNQSILKMQNAKDTNQILKMQAELQMLQVEVPRKHTFFVKNQQEFDEFTLENKYDTVSEMLDQKHNILRKDQLEKQLVEYDDEYQLKRIQRRLKDSYKKLADKKQSQHKMEKMMLKADYDKNLLSNDKRKLKKYKTGQIHKFFKERKR